MKKTLNKALSLVIVVIMLISMFPIYAFANDDETEDAAAYTLSFVIDGIPVSGYPQELASGAPLSGPSLDEGYQWRLEGTDIIYPRNTDWGAMTIASDMVFVAEQIVVPPPADDSLKDPGDDDPDGEEGGWGINGLTIPEGVTVTLVYGEGENAPTVVYTKGMIFGTNENTPAAPVAEEGKTFVHWYEAGGDKDVAFNFDIVPQETKTINLLPHFTDAGNGDEDEPQTQQKFVNFYVSETDAAPYGSLPIDENGQMIGQPFILLGSSIPEGKTNFLYWGASAEAAEPFNFSQTFADSVNVYAVFEARYIVQFEDAQGKVVDHFYVGPNEPVLASNADPGLIAGKQFKYWYANVDGDGNPVPYNFGGSTTTDIYLKPYFSSEYFVIFVSAGTQVPYQLVDSSSEMPYAKEPSPPTRAGYAFKGWSLDADGSSGLFKFGTPITDDTTLYAQWTATLTEYTVVYWREKANIAGDAGTDTSNYEYYSKEARTATAGSVLTLDAANYGGASVDYSEYAFATANYMDGAQAVVMGNGGTVINVYYKRIVYDFVFDLNPGDSGNTRRRSATMEFPRGGTVYAQGVDPDGVELANNKYSFKAKYEQDIENLWPSSWNATFKKQEKNGSNGEVSTQNFTSWSTSQIDGGLVTKRFTVTTDLVPTTGTTHTFTAQWGSNNKRAVEYWLEALPHETEGRVAKTVNNATKYFVKSELHSQDELWLSGNLNPKTLEGMTFRVRDDISDGDTVTTYRFYYTRSDYTLSFNGIEGGPAAPNVGNILFGTRLTEADHVPAAYRSDAATPATKTVDGVDYTFAGWYYDAEFMRPVEFGEVTTTMPNQNLGLFAKWSSTEYEVTFYDDAGGSTVIENENGDTFLGKGYGSYLQGSEAENFTTYVPGVTVVEGKGTFEGWYIARPGGGLIGYSYDTPIHGDLKLYANYITSGFQVTYSNGSGSGGVAVDVNGNHGGEGYKLGQDTRVADFIGDKPAEGEVFVGWAETHNEVETGELFYPGDNYTVSGNTEFVAKFGNLADYIEVVYHSNFPSELGLTQQTRTQYAKKDNAAHRTYGKIFELSSAVLEGWSLDADAASAGIALSSTISVPDMMSEVVDGKLHLYGVWNTNTPPRTVIFTTDGNGQVVYKGVTQNTHTINNILHGTTWDNAIGTNPTVVANAGYEFDTWKLDDVATNLPTDGNLPITRDYTYVATFKALPKNTVTFKTEGDVGGAELTPAAWLSQEVIVGANWSEIFVPTYTANENYEYYWAVTAADKTGLLDDPYKMSSDNGSYAINQDITYTLMAKKIIIITPPPTEYAMDGAPLNNFKVYGEADPADTYVLDITGADADLQAQLNNLLKVVRTEGDKTTGYEAVGDYVLSVQPKDADNWAAFVAENPNYNFDFSKTGVFHIIKRPLTISIAEVERWYEGGALVKDTLPATPEIAGTAGVADKAGLLSGHNVTPTGIPAEGTGSEDARVEYPTNAAISTFAVNYGTNAATNNYDITVEQGALIIKPLRTGLELNLENALGGADYTYDGTEKKLNDGTPVTGPKDLAAEAEAIQNMQYRVVSEADYLSANYYTDEGWQSAMPTRTDAGTYYIQARTNATGYKTAYAQAILTIDRAPITVTVGNNSKVFGENDPSTLAIPVVSDTPLAGDALKGLAIGDAALAVARETGETVGHYDIYVAASRDNTLKAAVAEANPNYSISYADGDFEITAKVINIELDPKDPVDPVNPDDPNADALGTGNSKIFGMIDPEFAVRLAVDQSETVDLAGFRASFADDAWAALFGRVNTTNENAGVYPLDISDVVAALNAYYEGPGGNDGGYTFKAVGNNNFYIQRRPITLLAEDYNKVYGEQNPAIYKGEAIDNYPDTENLSWYILDDMVDVFVKRMDSDENANDNLPKENRIALKPGYNMNLYVNPYCDANNFKVERIDGVMTIARRELLLTGHSAGPLVADGSVKEVTTFSIGRSTAVSGLVSKATGGLWDHSLSGVTARAGGSAVGTYYTVWNTIAMGIYDVDPMADSGNLLGNYKISTQNGSLVLVAPTVDTIYYNYTINYYADEIAGAPIGTVTGQGELGSAIPVTVNLYRSAAMTAAGYSDGLVYGDRIIRGDGQVINVLYSLTPEEEEVPPPEEEIDEPETPLVQQPEEELEEPEVPEAPPASWALLNLILAIVTVIVGIILLIGIFRKNKKNDEGENVDYASTEEDEDKRKSGIVWRIFGIIAAVLAPVVFFLTENMRNPMIFTDKWTLLMGLILLVQVVAVLLMRYVRNKEEDKDEGKENV